MTEAEEIAKFIAERGVTRVSAGPIVEKRKPYENRTFGGNRHHRGLRQLRERRKALDTSVKP